VIILRALSSLLRLTAALAVAAGLVTLCFGASQESGATRKSADGSYYLSCGEKEPYASRTAQSPVAVSPDGKHSAYVETKANWIHGQCVNSSRVFVQNDSGSYETVFLQEPTEMLMGNGIRVIDWSKDSSALLFQVQQWQWGSDADPTSEVHLYDAKTGIFKTVPFEHEIAKLGDGCLVTVQPLGFSDAGEVAVRFVAKQYFEPEGEPRKPACNAKQGIWIFDRKSNRLTQAADKIAVSKCGKTK
jgi:hypothetical protein